MALGSYNNWLGGQPDNGAGAAAGAQGNQVNWEIVLDKKILIFPSIVL